MDHAPRRLSSPGFLLAGGDRLGYELAMQCESQTKIPTQLLLDNWEVSPLREKRKRHHRPMAPSEAVRLERTREAGRAYYHRNKEKLRAYAKELQAKKRAERRATETPEQAEQRREWFRKYYADNHAERRSKLNAYIAKNRERFRPKRSQRRRIWLRQRRREDLVFKIVGQLRARVYHALRRARATKKAKTLTLVGCDVLTLISHIERQFVDGMNWQNVGNGHGRWNLDHIKPCSAFNMQNEAEQLACFHYTNLRPLWWIENMTKTSLWNGRYWKHTDHACVSPVEASASCSDKV